MVCKKYIAIILSILLVFSSSSIVFADIQKKEKALTIYENQKTF